MSPVGHPPPEGVHSSALGVGSTLHRRILTFWLHVLLRLQNGDKTSALTKISTCAPRCTSHVPHYTEESCRFGIIVFAFVLFVSNRRAYKGLLSLHSGALQVSHATPAGVGVPCRHGLHDISLHIVQLAYRLTRQARKR